MLRSFDQDFRALKALILAMGGKVEKAIEFAVKGLVERESKFFSEVHEVEKQINQAHIEVDETCLKLLARQSPLASDLRLVFSIVKINADLERMGDQAVNIAYNGAHYISKPPIERPIDLPRMTSAVQTMIRNSLDAFVRQDVTLARKVLSQDDSVDRFKNEILEELAEYMSKNPKTIMQALNLILIARNLERLGDHATNIAEEAIFDASGQDVRHGARAAR